MPLKPPGSLADRAARPDPDPTILTTQQLQREVGALKEIVFTRLDGMDRAIHLFNDNITRVPTDTDKQISQLKELIQETLKVHTERFDSIGVRFLERDQRYINGVTDAKELVATSMEAAKEAATKQNESFALSVAKSEAATNKQIDQLGALIGTQTNALRDIIDDMKTRLTRIEGEGRGQKIAETTQQTSNTSLVSIIGLIVGSLIGIGGIITAVVSHLR